MSVELVGMLQAARRELACPRCQNRGSVMKPLGLDECPECHGDLRNGATIELLEALVANTRMAELEALIDRVEALEGVVQP